MFLSLKKYFESIHHASYKLFVFKLTLMFKVDLRHKDEDRDEVALTNSKTDQLSPPIIDVGIDLSEFYMSVEWDILQVTCQ